MGYGNAIQRTQQLLLNYEISKLDPGWRAAPQKLGKPHIV